MTEHSGGDGDVAVDFEQFDLKGEIADAKAHKPWPSAVYAKTLCKKPDLRVVLISMEAASRMKEHHVDGSISVQVLQGSIRFTAQGTSHPMQTGEMLTLNASIKHDVEAVSEAVFLLTISWPDNQHLATMQHRGYGS